jgi:selenide,water dikinase
MAFDPDSIKYDKIKLMIQGAQSVLNKFNVSIVGGHTIKNSQLLYGFSVIGEVEKNRLKLNNTGNAGDLIVTTRPLGVGILSNAIKAEFIDEAKIGDDIWNIITGDNYFARTISEFEKVTSMTDVTGFGLVGHISELIGKGHLNAELEFGSIDFFENVLSLASNVTGSESGSFHNMKKYSDKVEYIRHLDLSEKIAIHDPQTNGGIVFTVSQQIWDENRADWISQNNNIKVIGKLVEGSGVILIK